MIVLSLLLLVAGAARLAAHRPDLWLGVSLTTMMLPVAATRAWLGPIGPLATVPPATWLLLAGAATLLLDQRRMVRRGTWAWLGAVIGVVLVATGAEYLLHGTSSVTPLVVLWVLPMSGFVAVVAASTAHRTADPLTAVTPWLACLAVSESLLAIAQRLTGSGLVFEQYRSFAAQFSRTGRAPGRSTPRSTSQRSSRSRSSSSCRADDRGRRGRARRSSPPASSAPGHGRASSSRSPWSPSVSRSGAADVSPTSCSRCRRRSAQRSRSRPQRSSRSSRGSVTVATVPPGHATSLARRACASSSPDRSQGTGWSTRTSTRSRTSRAASRTRGSPWRSGPASR